ncbi:MAG TPA: DUF4922 domain-containing protein, partial [Ignavibacteriaceae bacterium]
AAVRLYKKQSENWDLLKAGQAALSAVKTNKFLFNSFEIHTQFNPLRINSTSADVSREAISNRPCFLCVENLPAEQLGLLYNEKYLILCNPYPVFSEHLTVTCTVHKPQRIKNSFADMLRLSRDFNDYCFFYNGPASGASAPDHLHFQACKKNDLPIEMDYEGMKNEYGTEIMNNGVSVYAIDDGIRRMLSIESLSIRLVSQTFKEIYKLYTNITRNQVEPMMNIITSYEEDSGWRVIIFFRKKHRPDAFFKEGEGNILISPASIDLGGVIITPLEKDFKKIDKDIISGILREVTIGMEEFEYIKTSLR